ncbi:MAG: glycosyl-4,4-diaponeurosporenoate acyltransferase [Chloroflexota bacterium]|nr:glycosyl-4,4-diaponeurosporenoate acyltransferase [Chloroflexota bacterium]
MRIIYLEPMDTFILDILAWTVLQLGIGYLSLKFPRGWLDPNLPFFRSYDWEDEGKLYQRLFNVRAWKHLIPDGSKTYKRAYSIKRLASSELAHLKRWLRESVRSELCHWFMILPAPFFFLWNSIKGGWWMVVYAIANNLVPIILQRFNRPRMRKLIAQVELKAQQPTPILLPCPIERERSSV